MALTAEQVSRARTEAREFLEYSIFTIGLSLGILPEDISSSMTIPVGENDPEYWSYVSLIRQASILEQLEV
jgi:hypothetical protein